MVFLPMIINQCSKSHPLPIVRYLEWHFIGYADREIIANLLIRQVIGTLIGLLLFLNRMDTI